MIDIIDTEEVDRDTASLEDLKQQFSKKYKLLAETAVSLNKSYINKLHGTKSHKFAISLSDNSIEVYELTNTSLNKVCRLSGHKKELTEVVFCPKEDHLVYSTGYDGIIKLWDTRRSGSCVHKYKDKEEELPRRYECMDVSCNGRVLCSGSLIVEDDSYLVFWDQRNNEKALGGYWNSHTDDITQVKFHKEKSHTLASGSLDGLLNVYNILETTEDDALTYSLNIENSIDKLSWLDEKHIACITQSSDVQIWDAASGDMVKSYDRNKIARSIKRSRDDDCYVVDVYRSTDDTTVLLAGSHGGDGDVLRSVTVRDKKLQPCTNFTGNKQIVRCCWYDRAKDVLVTAGESGLISVWSSGGGGAGAGVAPTRNGSSQKLATAMKKLHVKRHKPY